MKRRILLLTSGVLMVLVILLVINWGLIRNTYISLQCQGAETEAEWYLCQEAHHRRGW